MSVAAYVGITSGAALVLTGIAVGLARPRRTAGWFFAGFVTVWGIEKALFNTFPFLDSLSTILVVERMAFAFVLVEILFLVHFTVRYTHGWDSKVAWWSWGTAAFTLAVGLWLAASPSTFSSTTGPTELANLLIVVPHFGVLFVTVGILASWHRTELRDLQHKEVRIVLVGLLLYVAYTAGFYFPLFGGAWILDPAGSPTSLKVLMVLFAVATAYLLYLAAGYIRLDESPPAWSSGERRLVCAAILVPMALGLATGIPAALDLGRIDLSGLLRIGSALLIAYGLLKFEIFGIDRTVKLGIRSSLVAGVFVVAFFAISEGVELLVSETVGTGAGLAAAGLLTLAFRPIEDAAGDVADRILPGVDDSEGYENRRKTAVYKAAVERAAGDQVLTDREKEILAGLREDLDLPTERARSIEENVLSRTVSV